jgi:hypothetical protein
MLKIMKIKLLFLLFMLFGMLPSQAQIQLGVKSGLNLSTLSGEGTESSLFNKPMFTGLNIGAFGLLSVSDGTSIQLGLEYSGKGVKYVQIDDSDNYSYIRLNYLEVPILLRQGLGKGDISGFVIGGPYL